FQFDMTEAGSGMEPDKLPSALRLPLWFVEGMAEYVSVGARDAHTAMWIRDAYQNERIPTMRQLRDPRFFPYRFGQAFWAYVAGRWGDESVGRIMNAAVRGAGPEGAFLSVLGVPADTVNAEWQTEIELAFESLRDMTSEPESYGRAVVTRETSGGRYNTGPALSPDGSELIALAVSDVFSMDMIRVDVETGEIISTVVRGGADSHLESIQFFKSAGEYHPAGDRVAFAGIRESDPILIVQNTTDASRLIERVFPDIGEIYDPTWSPDGQSIVFQALIGGYSDLFRFDLETDSLTRLTNDTYTEMQPAWSPNGRWLAFATDRFSSDHQLLVHGELGLGIIDMETGRVSSLPGFQNGKHLDPQWSPDSESLFFVSDAGGIANLFRMELDTGRKFQITKLFTGVSGITAMSPSLAVARESGAVAFSVYGDRSYSIFLIDDPSRLEGEFVTDRTVGR
ncbi:MAG: peptidase S9, partial [Gemmatimonadota bacterium]|nr:peptidase S9 [Gemmatimonadota bacterium]